MTTVSIHREKGEKGEQVAPRYRAVAGRHQTLGRTAGEALDALNAELDESESGSLILIQQMQPDLYFSEAQYLCMRDLLDRRETLSADEQAELEGLVKEELAASARRTQALADALGR